MSFAKTVKEELVTIPVNLEEQLAEFSAFLNLHTEFRIENKQSNRCKTVFTVGKNFISS